MLFGEHHVRELLKHGARPFKGMPVPVHPGQLLDESHAAF